MLAKRIEDAVKSCLGNLNWNYNKNEPDTTCDPPALFAVIVCLSQLAYDLLDHNHGNPSKKKTYAPLLPLGGDRDASREGHSHPKNTAGADNKRKRKNKPSSGIDF